MTRINLEHPSLLCNAHLVGEWYENPRVATMLIKKNGRTGNIPMRFTVRTNKKSRWRSWPCHILLQQIVMATHSIYDAHRRDEEAGL